MSKSPHMLGQSTRMLARDWRSGELRVLAAALVIAVASISSVAFLGDRVARAIARDANQLLGADLVLLSDRPWQEDFSQEINSSGLQGAEGMSFMSMALAGEKTQLAGVKAVTENYPLRGRLRIAPRQGAQDAVAESGPARGTVWLEERLVSALGAPVGSRVRLGDAEFQVAAVLTLEPERGVGFFNIAPRLMMNQADVASTGLIRPGSRVWYYLYAAGTAERLAAFEGWAKPRLERGQRIDNLESGRPEVRAAIDRAERYLGLTALLAAVLAGVAIALATRRFVERHLDGCAVMRCLGATQAKLVRLFGTEFAMLGLAASLVGLVIGYGVQFLVAASLETILRANLPLPSALPAVQGVAVGLVLLLGFALPPLLQLKNVPAVRVMRRESGGPRGSVLGAYAMGMGTLAALLIWQAGDLKLGVTVVGGFTAALAIFYVVAWLALKLVTSRYFTSRVRHRALRHGLANLRRHSRTNAVQVASLSLGLTAVLLLTFTHQDLVDAWRRSAPPDAPNRFVVGVQPEQIDAVKEFFARRNITTAEFYPMVRGRLIEVNGKPVSEGDFAEERAKRLVEREFNLSHMDAMPGHNVLSAGQWFKPGDKEVSAEEGIARTLGWKVGDTLRFTVAGESFDAKLTSLRKLRWDSMRVNFFVIAPTSLLKDFPATYVSAFRADGKQLEALDELAQRYSNLAVVDIGAVVRQVQGVVDQLISAVRFLFIFTLSAGLLVLYSALIATEDERRREAAVMRVYGASRAQVSGSQRAEFIAMGVLAGILATLGAAIIGQVIARRVFELDLPPSLSLWLAGPLAGLALLSLNAWLSARKVLRASPAITLRDSA
jgi:putative ABC transport system permease protein